MKLRHFFLPHPLTHKKAHLLSPWALLCYILLFIVLQFSLGQISKIRGGILGIATNVDTKTLIELTNQERLQNGLQPLKENQQLDSAALKKAQNMFTEDYWAHFAPSGKSPWDFIHGAGYQYTYAGENLARNFDSSSDVVTAWMNSPSHRDNLLNSHYQDIGMAVVSGTLLGEQTTLVVQEFGTPVEEIAQAPAPKLPTQISLAPQGANLSSGQTLGLPENASPKILIDPYQVSKDFGLGVIFILAVLLGLDFLIIRKRAVYRISSRHLPHFGLLVLAGTTILNFHPGAIL